MRKISKKEVIDKIFGTSTCIKCGKEDDKLLNEAFRRKYGWKGRPCDKCWDICIECKDLGRFECYEAGRCLFEESSV